MFLTIKKYKNVHYVYIRHINQFFYLRIITDKIKRYGISFNKRPSYIKFL